MTRVLFAACLFVSLPTLGAAAPSEAPAGAKCPNILFAFADDWGRVASAYAAVDGPGTISDVVKTPNIDRLAHEGVLFRHAFVSAPSCTPCRSALLSGQHFWRTGKGAILWGQWDSTYPSYPLMLRDAGYHIGKMYKVWSPGIEVDEPFGAQKYAYEKAGRQFNMFSENMTSMVASGKVAATAEQSLTAEVLDNFNTFLAGRAPDQPFCFWFGPVNVHRKWVRGSGKALWNLDPNSLQGKLPPFIPDVPEVREDMADYLGEVQALDAALGVLIERLEAMGELDNTLIVVSGDHGPPGFPHGKCNLYDFGSSVSLVARWGGANGGRVVDDLVSLTDLAPTFLEVGKAPVPESMTGRSLVNLLTADKSGQLDPRRDAVFIGRERHYPSARRELTPYPSRAIRTPQHLYIVNFEPDRWPLGNPFRLNGENPPTTEQVREDTHVTLRDEDAGPTKAWLVDHRHDPQGKPFYDRAYGKRPREELYYLKSDPHQMTNVANTPEYARVQAELDKRLLEELRSTGDPRMVDGGRFFESPPMAGPGTDALQAAQRRERKRQEAAQPPVRN